MADPATLIAVASAGTAGVAMASAAALKGWRGWLDVKRLQIAGAAQLTAPPSAAGRIELADLKERVRRLESIASGTL